WAGGRGVEAAGALVAVGQALHVVDVPVGVVVGEDRRVPVAGRTVGVQGARGGGDGVGGVVGVAAAVGVAVEAVGGPGSGHELHPADGAGAGDGEGAAEVGLDLVDGAQDEDPASAEPFVLRGAGVERQELGGDLLRAGRGD